MIEQNWLETEHAVDADMQYLNRDVNTSLNWLVLDCYLELELSNPEFGFSSPKGDL